MTSTVSGKPSPDQRGDHVQQRIRSVYRHSASNPAAVDGAAEMHRRASPCGATPGDPPNAGWHLAVDPERLASHSGPSGGACHAALDDRSRTLGYRCLALRYRSRDPASRNGRRGRNIAPRYPSGDTTEARHPLRSGELKLFEIPTTEKMMPKAYWIVRVSVRNQQRYPDYLAAARPAFEKYGARFIVRGGAFETMEGISRDRNVVVEFVDRDAAMACYRSPEYQTARAIRQRYADTD